MKQQIYKVAVSWEMFGEIEIEAISVDDALRIADEKFDELKLPIDGSYVDASFRIDADTTIAIN